VIRSIASGYKSIHCVNLLSAELARSVLGFLVAGLSPVGNVGSISDSPTRPPPRWTIGNLWFPGVENVEADLEFSVLQISLAQMPKPYIVQLDSSLVRARY